MKVQAWSMIALFVLLSACSSLSFFTGDKTLVERIDDARLIASGYAAEINYSAEQVPPLMSKTQAQEELDRIKEARDGLNEAEALLAAGDLKSAEARYRLADRLLLAVRAELAKRKKSSGGTSAPKSFFLRDAQFFARQAPFSFLSDRPGGGS